MVREIHVIVDSRVMARPILGAEEYVIDAHWEAPFAERQPEAVAAFAEGTCEVASEHSMCV